MYGGDTLLLYLVVSILFEVKISDRLLSDTDKLEMGQQIEDADEVSPTSE